MNTILKKCRKLDRKAQREMVDHLSPFLFNVVYRYSHSTEDAKDLLQESLIRIFNNIDTCKATEIIPFKAWCRRIAINIALTRIRKNSITFQSIDENMEEIARIEPSIDSEMHAADVLKLLRQLPGNQHLVFNLIVIDGYNHKEVGTILGINESSSRAYLTRARNTLQDLIVKNEMK